MNDPKHTSAGLSHIERQIASAVSQLPNNPGWNLFRVFEIEGLFSVTLLRKALEQLFSDHEILRTRFLKEAEEWKRVVLPNVEIPLEVCHVREPTTENRMRTAQQLLIEWQKRPILLDQPPYCFVGVVTTGWNHRFVMLRISHAIFDGISSSIVLHELLRLYLKQILFFSVLPQRRSSTPSDYVRWQKEESERQPEALHFWEEAERRFAPTLFPMSVPDPDVENTLAGIQRVRFSKESLGGLHRVRRLFRMTESFFLFTVLQLALSAETGRKRISIRLTSSNRSQGDVSHTIGSFANGLPFTTDIDESKTYGEWSQPLRRPYSNSLRWGGLYPEQAEMSPFILFNYYNSEVDAFYSRKLSYGIGSVKIRTDLVPFHMFPFHAKLLIVRNLGADLEFFLLYRQAWYSDKAITGFMDRYVQLIRWIIHNPDKPLMKGLSEIRSVATENDNE
jgi:pipecolate-incorporating enzyme